MACLKSSGECQQNACQAEYTETAYNRKKKEFMLISGSFILWLKALLRSSPSVFSPNFPGCASPAASLSHCYWQQVFSAFSV